MLSPSLDLQDMIYTRLTTDPNVTWNVFDNAPPQQPMPFIEFGPQDVQEDDAECITATSHQFQIDFYHSEAGKAELHEQMGIVKASLHNYPGELTDNALHSIRYIRDTIIREPDGINWHGVMQFEALIETP